MPFEISLPLVVLVIVGIAWFVGSHADTPSNNKNEQHVVDSENADQPEHDTVTIKRS